MLKINDIELELISDIDMHLLLEKVMIGSISYIAKSYSKVNNKYMKSYDGSKPSKYITYLNANNLYDCVMSQFLPYSGFTWLNQEEIDWFDVNSISENSLHVEYPDELRGLHNDCPLVQEKFNDTHREKNECYSI